VASIPTLICRVRGGLCGLRLEDVVETMRPLPIRSFAAASVAVASPSLASLIILGFSMIRGAPTPVVDAGALLGARDHPQPARFVTVRAGERCVALAVDGVLGVRDLPISSLQDLPPLLRDAGAEVITAVGTLDAELMVVLRAAHLVPESVWATLDSGRVAA
jgi:purine-binding chemotaxis protein CheW